MQLLTQQLSVRHYAHSSTERPFALSDIDLRIEAGEQIALIGPSGAGKSTLLHTLAAALQPTAGELLLGGEKVWAMNHTERHRFRRHLYLAPQTPPLPARQRVVTTVLAGRLPQWTLWKAVRSLLIPAEPEAAYAALSRFGLEDKLYQRVDQLSGGERQRCGLARILLSEATLLLVDEPLSALDPVLAQQTLDVLQAEARQRNATLICSLHQVELARSCFPRVIGLRDGRIQFDACSVSDDMLNTLYRQDGKANNNSNDDSTFETVTATEVAHQRCF